MTENEALRKMIAPGQRRPGTYRGGIIQIWVTRACDKACYGCTQGANLAGRPGMIAPEQFEQAVKTLVDYFGVVAMFGGNPCIHPHFDVLCEILRRHIPFHRRGLWSNNLLGKGAVCRMTFDPSVSNINVHMDRRAAEEIRRDWPEARIVGLDQDSRHPPPYVAMQDVIPDEGRRWELISGCDINQHWSAMIAVFRGELRAWFCEIAGAQSILHQYEPDYPDTGIPVVPGWWRRPMQDFAHQARFHCHACGVPLRGHGELSQATDGVEQTSATHAAIYRPKVRGRRVQIVTRLEQLGTPVGRVIDYLKNADLPQQPLGTE